MILEAHILYKLWAAFFWIIFGDAEKNNGLTYNC